MNAAVRQVLLNSVPGWVQAISPGSSPPFGALDFVNARYWYGTQVYGAYNAIPGWSFSRTGEEYAANAAGVYVPFTTNVPAITDLGLSCWPAATNVALWNRDLTNAAWTKTNATAAKDQTGIDAVANSASSLTATGANATALQAITLASSARFQTAFVKRITGSGVVQMTMDNGATWTAVTVTSAWTRVSIPTQTLANPTVGFRIVTSGDAIAVDFVQNETGVSASSPIATTSAAATRGSSTALISSLVVPNPQTMFVEWVKQADDLSTFAQVASLEDGSANQHVIYHRHTNNVVRAFVTGVADVTLGTASLNTTQRAAARFQTNDVNGALNGAAGVADTSAALFSVNRLYIGSRSSGSQLGGFVRRVALYPYAMSDNQMIGMTSP